MSTPARRRLMRDFKRLQVRPYACQSNYFWNLTCTYLLRRKAFLKDYFINFQEDPPAGVSGAPCDNNIMQWNAVIFGPADTPFEDGTFKLTISMTSRLEQFKKRSSMFFFLFYLQPLPRSTQISPPQCDLLAKCFIQMYMPMEVSIKIYNSLYMLLRDLIFFLSYCLMTSALLTLDLDNISTS